MLFVLLCSFAAALLGLSLTSYVFMEFFGLNKLNHFNVDGKTVLLTGYSGGIAKSIAKILSQKGANIVIAADNVEELATVVVECKASAIRENQRFHSINGDLSKVDEATRIVSEVSEWNGGNPPEVVWCLTGPSRSTLFLDSSPEQHRQMMDINYWSCVNIAQAILPQWKSSKPVAVAGESRHLIFTSSVRAFFSIAGYSSYSPTKAALRSFSDVLTHELKIYSTSIKMHTIFPGIIHEEENERKPEIIRQLESNDPKETADSVAERSIKGLENGEYLITTSWMGSILRGCSWAGSYRNNWLVDSLCMGVSNLALPFIRRDLDEKIIQYGTKHGHPSGYSKSIT